MGMKFGYKDGDMPVTEDISRKLVRLPFYNSMTVEEVDYVISTARSFFGCRLSSNSTSEKENQERQLI